MFTHILLAVDGSSQTPRVVALAAELASKTGARISVTCCVDESYAVDADTPGGPGEVSLYQPACEEQDTACQVVRAALTQLAPLGERVSGQVIVGEPAQALVTEAERQQASVIVMGHHRRTVFGRLLKGSVSADVVATAPCPVLVEVRE